MTNPFETSYLQTSELTFDEAISGLVKQITDTSKIISLVFFGQTNIERYFADFDCIKFVVSSQFNIVPLLSFIPQPMCGAHSFGLEIMEIDAGNATCEYKMLDDFRYAVLQMEWGQTLMVEGVNAGELSDLYSKQSSVVFKKIKAIFDKEDFLVSDSVRQWNYIGNILDFENGHQHYQLFNNARTEFYNRVDFVHGYPAATGISMSMNGLFVSVLAIKALPETAVIPIDNALQVPAYKYSESVLVSAKTDSLKSTPKFERGKLIVNNDTGIFYVSGTAAIRNEASMDEKDTALQTQQTIENINYLISNENLRYNHVENELYLSLQSIRVYVKYADDFALVKAEVERAWPQVTAIYVEAEVCRTGLLVEIEAVAGF